jgi:hypothetical protein
MKINESWDKASGIQGVRDLKRKKHWQISQG